MHLVTQPPSGAFDDTDAAALGKAWNKLDELAQVLGVAPLSSWIALPGEDDAGVAPAQLVPTLAALLDAVQDSQRKFPAKRAALAVLSKVRDQLQALPPHGGRVYFEIDI